jgi:hypothetical protein
MRRSSNQLAAVSQLADTIKRLQSTLKHSSAASGRQLLNQVLYLWLHAYASLSFDCLW